MERAKVGQLAESRSSRARVSTGETHDTSVQKREGIDEPKERETKELTMAAFSRQRRTQGRGQLKYLLLALSVLVIFWLISFGCLTIRWHGAPIGYVSSENTSWNGGKMKKPVSRILSRFSNVTATSDVRGNLGPVSVVTQQDPGIDWIKDRWQAASNMHGTAIKGTHWVQLDFGTEILVDKIVLDWEAAYSDKYRLEGSLGDPATDAADVWLLFDGTDASQEGLRSTVESGQSPGVKIKTPLHVVHTISPIREKKPLRYLRVFILNSAMGWGGKSYEVFSGKRKAINRLTMKSIKSHSGNWMSTESTNQRYVDTRQSADLLHGIADTDIFAYHCVQS